MRKKWSCPGCEYESGRRENMKRHIGRKHYSGAPVLNPQYGTVSQFVDMGQSFGLTSVSKNKIRSDNFAENYQFADKGLKIMKDFAVALDLPEGQTKYLIMTDLMVRAKNLNPPAFLSPYPMGYFSHPMSASKTISNYKVARPPPSIFTDETSRELAKFMESNNETRADSLRDEGMTTELLKPHDEQLKSALEKFSKDGMERKKLHNLKGY